MLVLGGIIFGEEIIEQYYLSLPINANISRNTLHASLAIKKQSTSLIKIERSVD